MSEEKIADVSILQLSYGNFVSLEDYEKLQQENQQLKEDYKVLRNLHSIGLNELNETQQQRNLYKSVIDEAISFINNNYLAEYPNEDILLEILDKAKKV